MERPGLENQPDGSQSMEIPDSFICCVCLDLLYKPLVLACGHVSCFWCVHKSMSGLRESHCPICRCQYHHFPNICQTLHLLLVKMYPIAYKRRENQILEDEKETGYFSPDLSRLVSAVCNNEELTPLHCLGQSSNVSSEDHLSSVPGVGALNGNKDEQEFVSVPEDISMNNERQTFIGSSEGAHVNGNKTCEKVSVADVLCGACRTLLLSPVALNCGHVFCEACIIKPVNEVLKCEVCQSPHPNGIPKVCLELDHFLEEQFPEERGLRRATIQRNHAESRNDNSVTDAGIDAGKGSPPDLPNEGKLVPWWTDHGSKVHVGVGCDSCGMYPIIGDRYRCKDCVEAIGFDQCGDCYNTCSKLPGRFNQQHTSEHRLEIVRSNSIRKIMLRLLRGQMEEAAGVSDLIGNEDDVFVPLSHGNGAEENAEDNSNVVVEDQSDNQAPPM